MTAAQPRNVGGTFIGSIETDDDHDWIAVELVAGQKYTFTLDGYGDNALVDPYLYVRDASGTVLTENDDGGGNLRFSSVLIISTASK